MGKILDVKRQNGYFKVRVNIFHFLLVFSLLFLMTAVSSYAVSSEGNFMILLKPIDEKASINSDSREVYEVRKGNVSLNTNVFYQRSGDTTASSDGVSLRNRVMEVVFFTDKKFNVLIERENRIDNKTVSLLGKISNSELSTFTLTMTDESFIINLQDLPNSRLYRVIGNSSTGIGIVTEIDQKKIPPMIHLPPIIPPTNE